MLVMVSAKDAAALPRRATDGIAQRGASAAAAPTVVGLPARRGARGRPRALRLRRRVRAAVDRGQRLRPDCPARARRRQGRRGGRSRPASSSSATRTSRTRCPPAPPPDEFGVNGSYLVYRKLHQDVAASGARCATRPSHVPGRRGAAGGQARRPLARRHAARHLAGPPGSRRWSPTRRATTRSTTARDPDGPALPGRLARAAHEPAPQPAVRRQAREPPPDHPPRDHLRRAAARGRRGRRRASAA